MPISKTLLYVFIIFYIAITVYMLAFFLFPDFQNLIVGIRGVFVDLTSGANYIWALLIAFVICMIGNASIGFPIPFPFVIFSLANSIMIKYGSVGLTLEMILINPNFWGEILGLVFVGGLGCAVGEFAGYIVGFGAKGLLEKSDSDTMKNLNGLGKLLMENESRAPIYIFLFALTPLPDDILFLPLGMIKYPWYKAIIPGWLGKSFTMLFYCSWPILVQIGLLGSGMELNTTSDIIIEGVMILITITVMMFIFSFDWGRYAADRDKRAQKFSEKSL